MVLHLGKKLVWLHGGTIVSEIALAQRICGSFIEFYINPKMGSKGKGMNI